MTLRVVFSYNKRNHVVSLTVLATFPNVFHMTTSNDTNTNKIFLSTTSTFC